MLPAPIPKRAIRAISLSSLESQRPSSLGGGRSHHLSRDQLQTLDVPTSATPAYLLALFHDYDYG